MPSQSKYRFYFRIAAPSVLAILLFVITSFAIIIPRFENNIFERKKTSIYDLTGVAYSILLEYHNKYCDSILTLEEAQSQAAASIEGMVYGPKGKDYFWLQDMHPNMIMHPYRPNMNGHSIKNYQGPDGIYIFREFVDLVKNEKEGYIQYIWQWYDDSTYLADKISFVKAFEPWDWIIGTGVYLEDFKNDIAHLKNQITRASILISVLIGIILFSIVRQSLIIEQKREKAEKDLHNLNQELEARVKQRTKLLNEANKDLESFAYSVSHDLRAPLRHIDGYTKKIIRSETVNQDPKITGYHEKIASSAKHMSQMIDDLLQLSQLGRKKLALEPVDLNSLIQNTIEGFKPDLETKKVEWTIHQLPLVKGDKRLLQFVFENLISNAIKYSSQREESKIEIGYIECKYDYECYIKDNGVGFDMKYADKLFGIFQRLHSSEDFEGVGIGLANVKQIINKHHGRVWAEAELDKGATFYVSLPK